MVNPIIEKREGEIRISFAEPVGGCKSLKSLGLTANDLQVEGGNMRMVLELGNLDEMKFYKMPTLEFHYDRKLGETAWQCEFNGEILLNKRDQSGSATVLLLDRSRLERLRQHHRNTLIIRADLPAEVTLDAAESCINLFEEAGC